MMKRMLGRRGSIIVRWGSIVLRVGATFNEAAKEKKKRKSISKTKGLGKGWNQPQGMPVQQLFHLLLTRAIRGGTVVNHHKGGRPVG